MAKSSDRTLLEACLDDLVRRGFGANVLQSYGSSIGSAAMRLARDVIAEPQAFLLHPLGFGRIPLTPWAMDKPRVAVHVWDSNARSALSDDIHDHCYDFASLACIGGLSHQIFEVTDMTSNHLMSAMRYPAGSCAAPGPPPEPQLTAVTKVRSLRVRQGEAYSFEHDVLHTAVATSELTVTVQFQSPCKKGEARVFRAAGAQRATAKYWDMAQVTRALEGVG